MPGTGFTSVADYLNANQGTLANEAGALSGDVLGQIGAARSADDAVAKGVKPGQDYTTAPGYADALDKQNAALDSAQNLSSVGGLQSLLQDRYAAPGYTADAARFDASLLGGNPAFAQAGDAAKGLSGYLDAQGQAAQGTPPPPNTDPGLEGSQRSPDLDQPSKVPDWKRPDPLDWPQSPQRSPRGGRPAAEEP